MSSVLGNSLEKHDKAHSRLIRLTSHCQTEACPVVLPCSPKHLSSTKNFLQMVAVQASFDPPDTLLWQLESEPLPPSPVAQWDKIPMKLHSGIQPFNCYESFGGEHSGLRHPSPGPVVNPEWDLKGQTCKDNVPVHHPSSELPSSQHWSSHQHSSTYGDPDDSHSQSMLETTGNSLKRGRCTHAVADCASGLLSGLMPSDSAPQYLSSPWRKCMRRGFLFPAATSYLEHVGSASGTCASEERQVMSLA